MYIVYLGIKLGDFATLEEDNRNVFFKGVEHETIATTKLSSTVEL